MQASGQKNPPHTQGRHFQDQARSGVILAGHRRPDVKLWNLDGRSCRPAEKYLVLWSLLCLTGQLYDSGIGPEWELRMTGQNHWFHWYMLIPFWPIYSVLVWAVWNSLRETKDQKKLLTSLQWPETQGRVTGNEVVWAHVRVTYEYSVAGITYCGRYDISLAPVVPGRSVTAVKTLNAEAQDALTKFPIGTRVVVRYNPARPEESVLYCSAGPIPAQNNSGPMNAPTFVSLNQ